MRRYGILAATLLFIPALAIAGGTLGQQNTISESKYTLLSDNEVVGVLTFPKGQGIRVLLQGRQFRVSGKSRLSVTGDVSLTAKRGDKTVFRVTADQVVMEKSATEPIPEVETTP